MNINRKSGVLLHISSLPTKYGVGTLGKEAYEFIDWMESAGLKIWQVLPLVPTNYGDSPYQSVCSTALNYYFIDFDILEEKGLLAKADYEGVFFGNNEDRVDYSALFNNKVSVLKKAFSNYNAKNKEFEEFLAKHEYDDFSLFMTIKALNNYNSWDQWDIKYQSYSKNLEMEICVKYSKEFLFWQWTQFEFLNEWKNLKKYACEKGISIMGDMPLYVAYDSVEVWKHPELFMLDENKRIVFAAGCPPDAFSDDGQLWGNPVYDWKYHKATGYKFWNYRISKAFELFDYLRIDHFRGFDRFYAIPAGNVNARIGSWLDGPKFDLFKDKLSLNIVAEDLGVIDEGVITLMKNTGYPGMKILEFAFDGSIYNEHKPSNYTENYLVYTGTHDNMPLKGYIDELSEKQLQTFIQDLKYECSELNVEAKYDIVTNLVNTVVELAFASKANICIIPIQDFLAQGSSTRMNLPSTVSTDNWSYRIRRDYLSDSLAKRILDYNTKYNR